MSELTKRILRTSDASKYVGLAPATLEKMRVVGGGPRFIRLGGRSVGYDIHDLDAWLDHQRSATDDEGRVSVT